MGPLKDPDPDGLHPIFYHSKWDVVGPVVCSLVKEAFRCPMKVEEINETLIVLTPNVNNPSHLKQFKPISLCNVVYKIITKVITQ